MGGLVPGASLIHRGLTGGLGANPIAEALNACGELAIKLLLLTLACTPVRILTGASWPIRARKHLGLLAFTYACAHLGVYVGLDRAGELETFIADLTERPFIMVGMAAFTLLVPLAITSTKGWIQRLGARRWRRLHKLVYIAAVLAIVHFVMRAKEDTTEAAIHGVVLAVLLGVRVYDKAKRIASQRRPQSERG